METAIEENFTSAAGANRQAFLEGLALGREYALSPVYTPSADSRGRITSERI
jgi:hypothetical protein